MGKLAKKSIGRPAMEELAARLKQCVARAEAALNPGPEQETMLVFQDPLLDDPASKSWFTVSVYTYLPIERSQKVPERVKVGHPRFKELPQAQQLFLYEEYDRQLRNFIHEVQKGYQAFSKIVADALMAEGLKVQSYRQVSPHITIWRSDVEVYNVPPLKRHTVYFTYYIAEAGVPKKPSGWLLKAARYLVDYLEETGGRTRDQLLAHLYDCPGSSTWPRYKGANNHLFGMSSTLVGHLWVPATLNHYTYEPCPPDEPGAVPGYVATRQARSLLNQWKRRSRGR